MILDDISSPSGVMSDTDFSFEGDDAHEETSIDYETHKPLLLVLCLLLPGLLDGQKALEEQ